MTSPSGMNVVNRTELVLNTELRQIWETLFTSVSLGSSSSSWLSGGPTECSPRGDCRWRVAIDLLFRKALILGET